LCVKEKLYLLLYNELPILEQLHIEEALLRVSSQKNFCLINTGTPDPHIILGLLNKPEELIAQKSSLPRIRRFSAGGTVVVDKNTLFITFVGEKATFGSSPKELLEFPKKIYTELFAPHPFSIQGHDYTFEKMKIGGNAQCLTKERALIHTSFVFDFDPFLMEELTIPKKQPDYREGRSHRQFIEPLCTHFPSMEHLKSKLCALLEKEYELTHTPQDMLQDLLLTSHRRVSCKLP